MNLENEILQTLLDIKGLLQEQLGMMKEMTKKRDEWLASRNSRDEKINDILQNVEDEVNEVRIKRLGISK
jgi:hypothetical protein